jgi:molybdopterin molybdotransferase
MILFEEALRIVLDAAQPLPSERVDLTDALGRILAEDVVSDMDMPPFDKSAMDGYACRRGDLANALRVVETVPAGRSPTKRIGKNECSKIMTGAPVPDGADCVIMVEYTEACGLGTIRFTGKPGRDNICPKGQDIRMGDIVMHRSALILDRHIAVLASVGCSRPLVTQRAKVGILATGDELVEPDETPGPSQIRNSNAYQLRAQVLRVGAAPTQYGITRDSEDALTERIQRASAENDVILLSGGVSAGDYDLVPPVLRSSGFDLLFEKVATKPGMPTVFGRSAKCFCFGLPGNPVSTFILFENLVKPFLFKLMGHEYRPWIAPMRLGSPVRRKKTDRVSWIPVAVTTEGIATPVEYHGSAHMNALCEADGLICVPIGTAEIPEGAFVDVRQI